MAEVGQNFRSTYSYYIFQQFVTHAFSLDLSKSTLLTPSDLCQIPLGGPVLLLKKSGLARPLCNSSLFRKFCALHHHILAHRSRALPSYPLLPCRLPVGQARNLSRALLQGRPYNLFNLFDEPTAIRHSSGPIHPRNRCGPAAYYIPPRPLYGDRNLHLAIYCVFCRFVLLC